MFLGAMACVVQAEVAQHNASLPEEKTPPVWDVAGLYAQAHMMLEDKSIKNVSAVPALLKQCAEAGYEPANMLLLDVYEGSRKGLEAQPEEAFKLACRLSMAKLPEGAGDEERQSRAEAMYKRALYHERGFGCKTSAKDAYVWMRRAAMEGLRQAQVELSRYLMNGVGHKAEPRMALMNLRKLAIQAPDTPNVYFYLGHMCLNGIGMPHPNRLMARRFFEKGAMHQDARSINNLASMYELGIGVKRDSAYAMRLYRQAADLGCKDASANLQRLAYKTDAFQRRVTTWRQRVGSAALRVMQAMPLEPKLRLWMETPFRRLATES